MAAKVHSAVPPADRKAVEQTATRNSQPPVNDETGVALSDADYANLVRRWIDKDLANAARIRRVDSDTGRLLVGRHDYASYEGLAIPYFFPGESRVREWRLRRDHPDIEYKDNRPRERGKYLSPPGRGNMIYFVPGLASELLNAVTTPVIVTEGEFKTLALWRLANYESSSQRFLPLGLGGVWTWRGTVGKTTGPNGDRRDVKGVIPDLNLIVWGSRRVTIAFDADADTNEQVAVARSLLARELRTRGAEVAFVNWDIAQGKGIDDLLANVGPEKVLELLEAADFENPTDAGDISVYQIAELISGRHRFARDAGGRLYIFRGGSYHPDGASFVREQVKRLLERMRLSSKWSSHKAEEVVKYTEVDAPLLWEKPRLGVVNVLNGLLDVNARTLSPHSPDFLSPVQLPVKFDPAACCPAWDKFVGEVFPADSEAIAWEIPAWLMTPDTSIQKAILLMGDGANGKSTYLRAVLSFIGRQNVAAISLHRLENDRFSVARLVGKLANICPDLPSEDLSSTSIFKAITGGDALLAERKFEESFEFVPFARLVFSANHPPKSQDASSAFFRRWVVVPFERVFRAGDPGRLPRDQLDAMLSDPAELSGVLNKALEALASIRANGLSESESSRRAMDEFRQTTDPLAVWLDRNTVPEPDALIPFDQLWRDYNNDCVAKGRPTLSKTALGRAIALLRPTVEKRQRTINGRLSWCYVGVGPLEVESE
jgi:P4 family phage/plasmid primase-like protien